MLLFFTLNIYTPGTIPSFKANLSSNKFLSSEFFNNYSWQSFFQQCRSPIKYSETIHFKVLQFFTVKCCCVCKSSVSC